MDFFRPIRIFLGWLKGRRLYRPITVRFEQPDPQNRRDPIALAKQVASLDVISGGRLVLGIGRGWNAEEMANRGIVQCKRRFGYVNFSSCPHCATRGRFTATQTRGSPPFVITDLP